MPEYVRMWSEDLKKRAKDGGKGSLGWESGRRKSNCVLDSPAPELCCFLFDQRLTWCVYEESTT